MVAELQVAPQDVLAVRDFRTGYGNNPIVHGVSMRARAGQITAILGPNGAGKSTLLKGIAGLIPRMGGTISLEGQDVTRLTTESLVRRGLSYVPQVENVFPNLTIEENLRMGTYLDPSRFPNSRDHVLDLFPPLRAALRRRAGTLSGGQRNMLALARGLMLNPSIVLLDEPTAGLAPSATSEAWQQITLLAQQGTAVVVVEQNVRSALQHSQYAYILVSGRNRYEGPSTEVLETENLGAMFLGS